MKTTILAAFALLLASPTYAYQIFLDIDTDDNPYTLNEFTTEESALVRMILAPDGDPEWITEIEFGLGGTCWMCWEDMFHMYGTHCELYEAWGPPGWLTHPLFDYSDLAGATCIDCCGNPGFHHIYFASAAGEGFELEEPIFIRDFMAYDIDHDVCEEPPADLMAFACGGPCNSILLSANASAVDQPESLPSTWQCIKSLY